MDPWIHGSAAGAAAGSAAGAAASAATVCTYHVEILHVLYVPICCCCMYLIT